MKGLQSDSAPPPVSKFTRDLPVPRLIQAGMGVRISSAHLASTTSRLGALGVVSSVGLRHIIVDEVRAGDSDAIETAKLFPIARYVDELLEFAPGGRLNRRHAPMDSPEPRKSELPKRLSAICAFIEVARAKRGHSGMVGINVMWKCSLTVLPSIYGAMLAGVDILLCGAGVPMELPDIVRRIQSRQDLAYEPLHGTETPVHLSIANDDLLGTEHTGTTPYLIPILSNFAFPKRILDIWEREYEGARPFAFVLENHAAGGHNAPPRNKQYFAEQDNIESYFDKVRDLGVPLYVAGAGSTRQDFVRWTERGAYGLQVGSRFALCRESGMRADLKEEIIARNAQGNGTVVTSSRLSSTGYPFKYVPITGTLSEQAVYTKRKRICNKGYLLQSHFTTRPDGSRHETYVCPGMPEPQYAKLGGEPADTPGRTCLCNALLATAGLGDPKEPALVTLGEIGANIRTATTAREIAEEILTPEYVLRMEKKLTDGNSTTE